MKKIICFLSLLVWVASTSVSAEETFPFLAEITGKNVNVRAGQSPNYERIMYLNTGDKVVVVDKGFSWYKIKLPAGSYCYVSSDYVRNLTGTIGEITGNRVNIRAGAGGEYSVLGQLSEGTKIRIQGTEGEWTVFEPIEGTYGWVHEDFLVFKSEFIPPPKVVEAPSRNIYRIRQAVREEEQRVEEEEVVATITERIESPKESVVAMSQPQPFTATGKVEGLGKSLGEGVSHRLIVNESTAYYLKGSKNILDRFINRNVKVDGDLYSEPSKISSPTIKVRKIRFIL